MTRLRMILTVLANMFNITQWFAARRAERRAEAQRERDHQLALLREFMGSMLDFTKTQQASIIALAEAQAKQADAFHEWLKGFTQVNMDPQPSSTVSEADEWERERAEQLRELGLPIDLPPEFQLAAVLERMNAEANGDFDREGSDFE